jgi:hypothetical protein
LSTWVPTVSTPISAGSFCVRPRASRATVPDPKCAAVVGPKLATWTTLLAPVLVVPPGALLVAMIVSLLTFDTALTSAVTPPLPVLVQCEFSFSSPANTSSVFVATLPSTGSLTAIRFEPPIAWTF